MLSLYEVHTSGFPSGAFEMEGNPLFYRPGPISWPPGSIGGNGSSSNSPVTDAASQSLFYLATCPATVQVGQVVYTTGPNRVEVADNQRPNAAVGIVTSKRAATVAVVQTAGEIVLGLSGLSPGVDYFLGSNGMLRPAPLSDVLFVQRIGMATTAERLYLQLDGHIIKQNAA